MTKMTPEAMGALMRGLFPDEQGALAKHLSVLESELAAARDAALEEALQRVAVLAKTFADAYHIEFAGSYPRELLQGAEEDVRSAMDDIRALKSKPEQATVTERARGLWCRHCRMTKKDHDDGLVGACAEFSTVEMSSEDNDLLPKKRQREHEYGEEYVAEFGARVANCKRGRCQAYRVKTRDGKRTTFKQHYLSPSTTEPGPCEVEP